MSLVIVAILAGAAGFALAALLRTQPMDPEVLQRNVAGADARDAVRGGRGELQSLVEGSPDPMILTDATEHVLMLNAAAARLLEMAPASMIGRPFVSVITDQVLLDVYDAARAGGIISGSAARQVKVTRSGTRLVFEAVAIRSGDGSVMLLLRDVTQMAAIVQMKTDFVTNAGHELRTPVAAVRMAVETLKECAADDPVQTQKCLVIIDGQVKRLQEMLGDLLDLSRVESPELEAEVHPIRATELFPQIAATLGVAARERGLLLEMSAEPAGCELRTDVRLLNLVLRNLVENAIKFTPTGGTVRAVIRCGDAGDWALTVSDNGVGIPPEHHARVFERFYQVDAARTGGGTRGTGLGLAIVKHAVQVLGGTIELESVPGKGTTMRCAFRAGETMLMNAGSAAR